MLKYLREAWDMTGEKTKLVSVAIFFVAGILFVGLVYILRNWHGESGISREAPVEDTSQSIREAIRAEEGSGIVLPMSVAARSVLDRHFDALGGVEKIASVTSFRMSGWVEYPNGGRQDIVMVKKSGGRMWITEKFDNGQRVRGVSPKGSWIAYSQNGILLKVEDMPMAETDRQKDNANVVSELYMALQNSWDTKYIGQRDFNYQMTHVFEVTTRPKHSVRFMIDPDTFLDVGQEERLFEEDGSLTIIRRMNSDHQEWNGLIVPGKIEVFQNDVLLQTIHVTNIGVNPGILDTLFEKPELR